MHDIEFQSSLNIYKYQILHFSFHCSTTICLVVRFNYFIVTKISLSCPDLFLNIISALLCVYVSAFTEGDTVFKCYYIKHVASILSQYFQKSLFFNFFLQQVDHSMFSCRTLTVKLLGSNENKFCK